MKALSILLFAVACILPLTMTFAGQEPEKTKTPAPLNPAEILSLAEKTLAGDRAGADSLWQNRRGLAVTSGKNLAGKPFDENAADSKILAALAGLGDAEALTLILEYSSSTDLKLADWATKTLGEPASKMVTLDLIQKLKSDNPKTRQDAVFALTQLKDICALRPIIALAQDSAPEVRLKVAEALNGFKSPLSVEVAAKMAREDTDPDTRIAAVNALAANGSTRTDILVAALDDTDGYVRLAALAALKTFHDKAAIPKLLKLLENPGAGLKGRQFTIVSSAQGNVVKTEVNTIDERHQKIIANCANNALKAITGQDFEYDSYLTAGEQLAARAKWLNWWKENEKTFTVKTPAPKANDAK